MFAMIIIAAHQDIPVEVNVNILRNGAGGCAFQAVRARKLINESAAIVPRPMPHDLDLARIHGLQGIHAPVPFLRDWLMARDDEFIHASLAQ